MTTNKIAALGLGVIGVLAVSVWAGSQFMSRNVSETALGQPVPPPPPDYVRARSTSAAREPAAPVVLVSMASPEFHARMKPLLGRGADLTIASAGFRSAEEFAAIAHAAHNTEIPFMLLKHRVLDEGKTLAAAITESKPAMDAKTEADKAKTEAKSDIALLAG